MVGRFATFVLLAAALSGCLNAVNPPGAATAGWVLDCDVAADPGWMQACSTRASHTDGPKQEIWLAINPANTANVVLGAKDNNPASSPGCTWNGVFVTLDGGATWTDVVIGGAYADRQPGDPWFGYACNTDPMFAFNREGDLHYVVEMYNLGGQDSSGPLGAGAETGRALLLPGWRVLLATSHDGGLTWPDVTTQLEGDGSLVIPDYSQIAVSPVTDTVVTMINSFQGTGGTLAGAGVPPGPDAGVANYAYCNLIRSTDNGLTTEPPVIVAAPPGTAGRATPNLFCGSLDAAADGTLTVGFMQFGDGNVTTWWSRSTDDGASFSTPAPSFSYPTEPFGQFEENQFRPGPNFQAAYDRSLGPMQGRLYLTTMHLAEADADVVLYASDDHGASWSDGVLVHPSDDNDQWLANVAVAGDGSVHVFYFDKGFDPANKLIDVSHAISTDGGATWVNERVTTVSFDGDLGVHQEGFPFIGDYIGVDAVGDVVWVGYPDASVGNTTVVAAASSVRAS